MQPTIAGEEERTLDVLPFTGCRYKGLHLVDSQVLDSPKELTADRRASPTPPIIGRTSITEKRQIFPGCTLLICGFGLTYSQERGARTFSSGLKHLLPPSLSLYPNSFSPACELLNPVLRFVRFVFACVRIISFEWRVTVKDMTFRIGLLATRLPISECFQGAGIGFASHKTAGSAGKSRTIRRANCRYEAPANSERRQTRGKERDNRKSKSRTVCHSHAQKNAR